MPSTSSSPDYTNEFGGGNLFGMLGGAAISSIASLFGQNSQQKFATEQQNKELRMRAAGANNLYGLTGQMPNFQSMMSQLPNPQQYLNQSDPSKYFQQSQLNPEQYFSGDQINKNYDQALANLNRLQGSQMGQAAQSAGESAAARGLTNPTAFTGRAMQGVRDTYAPQFGQLEMGRGNALQANQQALYGAKFNQQGFNAQQAQGLYGAQTNQQQNIYSALMQQLQMQMSGAQNDWSNKFGLQSAINNTILGG